jgi:hypothetical protein
MRKIMEIIMNNEKNRPFNQRIPNGRDFEGYGNTRLSENERVNRYELGWLAAIVIGMIALGVVINAFWALLDGGVL